MKKKKILYYLVGGGEACDCGSNTLKVNTKSLKQIASERSKRIKKLIIDFWPYIAILILLAYAIYKYIKYWPSRRIPRELQKFNIYEDYARDNGLRSCTICFQDADVSQNSEYQSTIKYNSNGNITYESSCEGVLLPYRLCDFYVSSSYKSYIISDLKKDYVSASAISKLLRGGCRFIDLDIWNNGFQCLQENMVPVVTEAAMPGLRNKMYNYVTFEDCCTEIARCAWSENCVLNKEDPVFLNLRLHTQRNVYIVNKVAAIIHRIFNRHLLSKRYTYQKNSISRIPIVDLAQKIVILCNPIEEFRKTKLEEFVNCSNSNPFLRSYNDREFEVGAPSYDVNSTIDFNRRNLTIVYPKNNNDEIKNYNPLIPWTQGCQFVCMNWSKIDNNMSVYRSKFRYNSLVLKPCSLRYRPPVYVKPREQESKYYYNTLEIKNPFYTAKI